MTKTNSLGVRLNSELKTALEELARKDRRSLSSMIEKILTDRIEKSYADGYAWEKSYLAVMGLATRTCSLKEQVGAAYMYHLTHIHSENVSDPEIRAMLADVAGRVTRIKANGSEGSVAATVAKMSDEEALYLAGVIFRIHDRIARQYGED
jgi:hypothetical protein